jgi:hypothetical protein
MPTEDKKKLRTTPTRSTKAVDDAPIDPFAEIVDVAAAKPAAKTAAAAKKPRAKKVEAKSEDVAADAFAEPVIESSPVKKRAVRAKKADAATETRKAAPKKRKATSRKKAVVETIEVADATAKIATEEPEVELSPAFKALANVDLPELKRENRAHLLMQSPTRLYFYWSIRENPWQRLRAIFGDDLGSYTLVLKLNDRKSGAEQMFPCEAEGNWWFNVDPDGEYDAEIGFYAVNRPYFRILYSNVVSTPRRNPSPRPASEAQWAVSANKFAEVLDVSGFARDAYDVALAGDDPITADNATHIAFSKFVDTSGYALSGISAEDIRYAMIALAAGNTLEELRWRIGPSLFAILQSNAANLAAENARKALGEYFDIDETEWTEEEFSSAVYGASVVNFPKTLRRRNVSSAVSPRYNPVSSSTLGR